MTYSEWLSALTLHVPELDPEMVHNGGAYAIYTFGHGTHQWCMYVGNEEGVIALGGRRRGRVGIFAAPVHAGGDVVYGSEEQLPLEVMMFLVAHKEEILHGRRQVEEAGQEEAQG